MKRTLLFLYVICAFIFCVNAQEKSLKYFDKTIPSILEITKQNTPQRRKVKSMAVKTNTVENLLCLNEHTTAVLVDTLTDIKGGFHESYVEYYKGVEVEGTRCTIHYDNTGQAVLMTGNFRTIENLSVIPFLKETEALVFANSYASKKSINKLFNTSVLPNKGKNSVRGQLLVYMVGDIPHLSYKFPVTNIQLYVYVDAMTGDVVGECAMNHQVSAMVNTVYSGQVQIETQYYSGTYRLRDNMRGNGIETYKQNGSDFTSSNSTWSNLSTNERGALDTHWGFEKVFDAYSAYFGRNSYDNKGAKIKSYVNWYEDGEPYNNAYWRSSSKSFTFGYANKDLLKPYGCLDVVAHEFTHAVTSSTSNLKYEAESGALNEGMSDVFATYIEKKVKPTKGYKIWQIGEDTKNYRDLRYPTCKYYKGSGWKNTLDTSYENDYGGVHTNSGVFSYWFYLISEGNSAKGISAIGIEKAIQLCYLMNTSYLSHYSTYSYAKECSYRAAKQLGYTEQELKQIQKAWYVVGVENIDPDATPTGGIANFSYNVSNKTVTIDYVSQNVRNTYVRIYRLGTNTCLQTTSVPSASTCNRQTISVASLPAGGIYEVRLYGDDTMFDYKTIGTPPEQEPTPVTPTIEKSEITSCSYSSGSISVGYKLASSAKTAEIRVLSTQNGSVVTTKTLSVNPSTGTTNIYSSSLKTGMYAVVLFVNGSSTDGKTIYIR